MTTQTIIQNHPLLIIKQFQMQQDKLPSKMKALLQIIQKQYEYIIEKKEQLEEKQPSLAQFYSSLHQHCQDKFQNLQETIQNLIQTAQDFNIKIKLFLKERQSNSMTEQQLFNIYDYTLSILLLYQKPSVQLLNQHITYIVQLLTNPQIFEATRLNLVLYINDPQIFQRFSQLIFQYIQENLLQIKKLKTVQREIIPMVSLLGQISQINDQVHQETFDFVVGQLFKTAERHVLKQAMFNSVSKILTSSQQSKFYEKLINNLSSVTDNLKNSKHQLTVISILTEYSINYPNFLKQKEGQKYIQLMQQNMNQCIFCFIRLVSKLCFNADIFNAQQMNNINFVNQINEQHQQLLQQFMQALVYNFEFRLSNMQSISQLYYFNNYFDLQDASNYMNPNYINYVYFELLPQLQMSDDVKIKNQLFIEHLDFLKLLFRINIQFFAQYIQNQQNQQYSSLLQNLFKDGQISNNSIKQDQVVKLFTLLIFSISNNQSVDTDEQRQDIQQANKVQLLNIQQMQQQFLKQLQTQNYYQLLNQVYQENKSYFINQLIQQNFDQNMLVLISNIDNYKEQFTIKQFKYLLLFIINAKYYQNILQIQSLDGNTNNKLVNNNQNQLSIEQLFNFQLQVLNLIFQNIRLYDQEGKYISVFLDEVSEDLLNNINLQMQLKQSTFIEQFEQSLISCYLTDFNINSSQITNKHIQQKCLGTLTLFKSKILNYEGLLVALNNSINTSVQFSDNISSSSNEQFSQINQALFDYRKLIYLLRNTQININNISQMQRQVQMIIKHLYITLNKSQFNIRERYLFAAVFRSDLFINFQLAYNEANSISQAFIFIFKNLSHHQLSEMTELMSDQLPLYQNSCFNDIKQSIKLYVGYVYTLKNNEAMKFENQLEKVANIGNSHSHQILLFNYINNYFIKAVLQPQQMSLAQKLPQVDNIMDQFYNVFYLLPISKQITTYFSSNYNNFNNLIQGELMEQLKMDSFIETFSQQSLFYLSVLMSYIIYNKEQYVVDESVINVILYPLIRIILDCPILYYQASLLLEKVNQVYNLTQKINNYQNITETTEKQNSNAKLKVNLYTLNDIDKIDHKICNKQDISQILTTYILNYNETLVQQNLNFNQKSQKLTESNLYKFNFVVKLLSSKEFNDFIESFCFKQQVQLHQNTINQLDSIKLQNYILLRHVITNNSYINYMLHYQQINTLIQDQLISFKNKLKEGSLDSVITNQPENKDCSQQNDSFISMNEQTQKIFQVSQFDNIKPNLDKLLQPEDIDVEKVIYQLNELQNLYKKSFESTVNISEFVMMLKPFIIKSTFNDYQVFEWLFMQLFMNIKQYEKFLVIIKYLFDSQNLTKLTKFDDGIQHNFKQVESIQQSINKDNSTNNQSQLSYQMNYNLEEKIECLDEENCDDVQNKAQLINNNKQYVLTTKQQVSQTPKISLDKSYENYEKLPLAKRYMLYIFESLQKSLQLGVLQIMKFPDYKIQFEIKQLLNCQSDMHNVKMQLFSQTANYILQDLINNPQFNRKYFETIQAKSDLSQRLQIGFNGQLEKQACLNYFPLCAIIMAMVLLCNQEEYSNKAVIMINETLLNSVLTNKLLKQYITSKMAQIVTTQPLIYFQQFLCNCSVLAPGCLYFLKSIHIQNFETAQNILMNLITGYFNNNYIFSKSRRIFSLINELSSNKDYSRLSTTSIADYSVCNDSSFDDSKFSSKALEKIDDKFNNLTEMFIRFVFDCLSQYEIDYATIVLSKMLELVNNLEVEQKHIFFVKMVEFYANNNYFISTFNVKLIHDAKQVNLKNKPSLKKNQLQNKSRSMSTSKSQHYDSFTRQKSTKMLESKSMSKYAQITSVQSLLHVSEAFNTSFKQTLIEKLFVQQSIQTHDNFDYIVQILMLFIYNINSVINNNDEDDSFFKSAQKLNIHKTLLYQYQFKYESIYSLASRALLSEVVQNNLKLQLHNQLLFSSLALLFHNSLYKGIRDMYNEDIQETNMDNNSNFSEDSNVRGSVTKIQKKQQKQTTTQSIYKQGISENNMETFYFLKNFVQNDVSPNNFLNIVFNQFARYGNDFLLNLSDYLLQQAFLQSTINIIHQQPTISSQQMNNIKQQLTYIDEPFITVPSLEDKTFLTINFQKEKILEAVNWILLYYCSNYKQQQINQELVVKLIKTLAYLQVHTLMIQCQQTTESFTTYLYQLYRANYLIFTLTVFIKNDNITKKYAKFLKMLALHPLTQYLCYTLYTNIIKPRNYQLEIFIEQFKSVPVYKIIQMNEYEDYESLQLKTNLNVLQKEIQEQLRQEKFNYFENQISTLDSSLFNYLTRQFGGLADTYSGLSIDFQKANECGHKVVRQILTQHLQVIKIQRPELNLQTIEKQYKQFYISRSNQGQEQSLFQTILQFSDQQYSAHCAFALTEIYNTILLKSFNPKKTIYSLINKLFIDINIIHHEQYKLQWQKQSKEIAQYCYQLIKADCLFGVNVDQITQLVQQNDMSVYKLVEKLNINQQFYETLIDIALHSRRFELPALLLLYQLFNSVINVQCDYIFKLENQQYKLSSFGQQIAQQYISQYKLKNNSKLKSTQLTDYLNQVSIQDIINQLDDFE